MCKLVILNFSSAIGDHLEKVNTLLTSLVKMLSLRLLKDGLATELLRQTCKGGLIFSVFSTMYIHPKDLITFFIGIVGIDQGYSCTPKTGYEIS